MSQRTNGGAFLAALTQIIKGGLLTTSSDGLGYASGSGGTITQASNKGTGVTLNKITGQITMNNASLSAGVEVSFTVTNSTILATDVILVNHSSGGTAGAYLPVANAIVKGSFAITVSNLSAGSLSEAIVLSFAVLRAASA